MGLAGAGGGFDMFDNRQNRQSYVDNFELYKRITNLPRGARLKWEAKPSVHFIGRIYQNLENTNMNIDGVFLANEEQYIVKTPDKSDVHVMDRVKHVETGKIYLVTNVSIDARKNRFRGRFDALRTVDTYITMKGA